MPDFEMEWRDALFASWPVEPDLLAPRLPDRLTVDTFEGDAYLSVVPFAIRDIRPEGLPAAVGLSTPELNLRTYVRCDDTPGVYFFSLDAGDLLGVVGARVFNHLPYYLADIDYEPDGPDGRSRFASRRRTPGARAARFDAAYGPDGERFRPEPGSVEHFLVERYRYFAEGPDGEIRAGEHAVSDQRLRRADRRAQSRLRRPAGSVGWGDRAVGVTPDGATTHSRPGVRRENPQVRPSHPHRVCGQRSCSRGSRPNSSASSTA